MTSTPSAVSVTLRPGVHFSKVLITFQARKTCAMFAVFTFKKSFNNFENNKVKLSVNEAKLPGFWTTCRYLAFREPLTQAFVRESYFVPSQKRLLYSQDQHFFPPICQSNAYGTYQNLVSLPWTQKLFTQPEPGQMILIKLLAPVFIKFKISRLNSFQIKAIYEFLK